MRELEAFAADARAHLDALLDAHAPLSDLEDVVERAHELAPGRVSESAIERARRVTTLSAIAEAPLAPAHADALGAFNEDARALLDAELAPRDMAAVVPPRRLVVPRRPRWTWAAAAAIFLLAGGAIAGLAGVQIGSSETAVQAEHVATPTPQLGSASEPGKTRPESEIRPEQEPPPQLEPAPDQPPALEEGAQPEADTRPHSEPEPRATPDRLAELDALAQAQWKSGDTRAAEHTFEKIVKLGGRTPYAEQAYGELFALAHQLHGQDEQAKLWRAYLRRFPHGRYADAARSGLCRTSEGQARRQCWTRYLDKHPKGAARAEALRETAG